MDIKKTRKNFFTIDREKYIECNSVNIKKVVDILNKERLAIVSWLKNIWKVNFIKEFIHKTNSSNSYFYFNKSDDIENNIKSYSDLENLLNEYIQLYKKPTIIILQNINKIEWTKEFITHIYKENYKTILVWNNIQIWWIKEVQILANPDTSNWNIEDIIKYWVINEIKEIENIELKEKFLKLLINDIFLNDIFKNFWVKSINLYIFTMTYLAQNNSFLSLRDLQKQLNVIQKISLKTTIDYVDFSLQVKILKRVYRYDIKNNKPITSKAKYYFTDNWIRNGLDQFMLNESTLFENLIFNKLEHNNFTVYAWLNWKFDFSFYGVNWDLKIYIHISKHRQKDDIKKEVGKLLKMWEPWNKYLLVENINKLWIKKFRYDTVEIMDVVDFLRKY